MFQDQSGSNDKADKFGDDDVDYEYTNESGSAGGSSDTSRSRPDVVQTFASVAFALLLHQQVLGRVNPFRTT
jgi:hypothetical protein